MASPSITCTLGPNPNSDINLNASNLNPATNVTYRITASGSSYDSGDFSGVPTFFDADHAYPFSRL